MEGSPWPRCRGARGVGEGWGRAAWGVGEGRAGGRGVAGGMAGAAAGSRRTVRGMGNAHLLTGRNASDSFTSLLDHSGLWKQVRLALEFKLASCSMHLPLGAWGRAWVMAAWGRGAG
jgi:hypothetical protein